MEPRDILRKLIPIGRTEARIQFYELSLKSMYSRRNACTIR